MPQTFPNEPTALQWALPDALEVPPDTLKLRLDFYASSIMLHVVDGSTYTTRMVSPLDVAAAMARDMRFSSGLLPPDTLWWQTSGEGAKIALWRKPQVWKVALQMEPFKPPLRFHLPMPGLVFLVRAGAAPWVYAAKRRPQSQEDELYHGPLFNVFSSGQTCPGTHRYSGDVGAQPEEFFSSFFTVAGEPRGRSFRFKSDLLALWESLDGKRRYPVWDLVAWGTVEKLLTGGTHGT